MSRTKFITLGTAGGPTPKPHRMPPAHAVAYDGGTILVDCGEGAFQQLGRAGYDLRQVRDLFITHHHFDHIGSLFACLGLNMMTHRNQQMNIYGPPGTSEILEHLITACDIPQSIGFGIPGQILPHPRDFIVSRDIRPGDVVEIDSVRVSCCENTHYRSEDQFGQDGPVSLSYRFDTADRSMVFTGDTGPCRALEDLAMGADLLVGELIDPDIVIKRIIDKNPEMSKQSLQKMRQHLSEHHLTPEELGGLAANAGVNQLVAVHIPFVTKSAEEDAKYVSRISAKFGGSVTISIDQAAY
jgi:ribonuclease BN (tRNA processing enzyme)